MKQCHFIGIGGIGMSGLARILLRKKVPVTGSDLASSYVTDGLKQAGAEVFIGHDAKYISSNSTVVYNTDIKKDNPELLAAQNLQCQMLHRSDLLHYLMNGYKTLAVTGTHGKTTTSALLTAAFVNEGLDPCFAVGGIITQLHANASYGEGNYFIAEADESDGSFLKYHPYGAIITNIDLDHMNYFGTEEALITAFHQFAAKVESPQHLFWCGDDYRLQNLKLPGVSYGVGPSCMLRAVNITQKGWITSFDIEFRGKCYPKIKSTLIGHHNVLNALAVFGLGLSLGIKESALRRTLETFEGVGRRCEKKGEMQKILLLDDYAHHPTEVKTTLEGIRNSISEKRLVTVFQPHRYSRTKDCLGSYGNIFEAADVLFITDIFAATESPIPGVTHEAVLAEIQNNSTIPCRYVPRKQLADTLAKFLQPHDVMVTLGAGDVTKLSGEILTLWKQTPPKKLQVGVIYGGYSVEHEISLSSAKHVCSGFENEYCHIHHFGITKQGRWITGPETMIRLKAMLNHDRAPEDSLKIPGNVIEELQKCDVLFPVLHGALGEDGTIQGLFEMLGRAYVGCDYRSAAIAMDKTLTKRMVASAGVPIAPYISFNDTEWAHNHADLTKEILDKLTFPVFVKPVHLGSSIGVHKVENLHELEKAIYNAFKVDTALIVENGIQGREIEFSLLGNHEVAVFPPGEILSKGKVYSYEAKYSEQGFPTSAHADLPPHLQEIGMGLAKRAYMAAGCCGMARIDFFLDRANQFWFNEINPIPGFTPISLYPQMCALGGYNIQELDDKLVQLALQNKRRKDRLKQVL